MNTITVAIPSSAPAPYEVRIAAGLLETLGPAVRALAPAPSCAHITATTVAPHYHHAALQSLTAAGYRVIEHVFPAGEENKTVHTAVGALDAILAPKAGGVERRSPVIALGGGVVGDLAGFAAATLLRGVPFIQCPTTLLAAVDASVGGKVGVDHPAGKNLIGAFHQPRLVLTDIATFSTLPPREMCGGLAECIKHAVIRDASLFTFISDNLSRIMACDQAALGELVARNVAIKAAIVQEDPYEKSVRALLNLGHTFGHAIETLHNYKGVSHGEAVALGMIAAGRLANARRTFPTEDLRKLHALLRQTGLPTTISVDPDKAITAMASDKKVQAGRIRLVLPTRIGQAEVVQDADPQEIRTALMQLAEPLSL
jgi:3-dehydroquinate synthase